MSTLRLWFVKLTEKLASLFINVKNIYRGLEKDTMIPNGLTIWNQYCTPIESDYLLWREYRTCCSMMKLIIVTVWMFSYMSSSYMFRWRYRDRSMLVMSHMTLHIKQIGFHFLERTYIPEEKQWYLDDSDICLLLFSYYSYGIYKG